MKSWKSVDEYIGAAPKEAHPKLKQVRAAIREVAPDAVESISYGMAFYSYKGETGFKARLCYFGILKESIAFYMRPQDFEEHMSEVARYVTTKSALHLPLDKPVPVPLIKKLVGDAINRHNLQNRTVTQRVGTKGRARRQTQ